MFVIETRILLNSVFDCVSVDTHTIIEFFVDAGHKLSGQGVQELLLVGVEDIGHQESDERVSKCLCKGDFRVA